MVPAVLTRREPRALAPLLVVALLLTLAAPAGARSAGPPTGPPNQASQGRQVDHRLRALVGVEHPRIVDAQGRQVLLRGVNVVQLGDYFQADPDSPPTFPLTEEDFARIAELGFNAVRLVVHWSRLEPRPGELDGAYLDRIRQAVDWARGHDLYTVVDLHQDAWSKSLVTPPGQACPPPTSPAIGWDGAPAWATLTDGLSTCKLQAREFSPAVAQAFTSFWLDRPGPDGVGIQTHAVRVWAALAGHLATDPAVAGYDLFNEPHPGWLAATGDTALLGRYYDRAIDAIRAAERAAGGRGHIAFFEPSILWSGLGAAPPVPPGFTDDDNLVFAPHLYAGSLSVTPGVGVEEGFEAAAAAAEAYGTTFWSGEWGWFGDPDADADQVARYAAEEDAHAVGGAWWSWRQACGDPHNHRTPGGPPPVSPSLVRYACPGNVELGVPEAFATLLSRPYPRAAPGRIVSLESDPDAAHLRLVGAAGDAVGRHLDLWVPDRGQGHPHVTGTNVERIRARPVPGGFRVSGRVTGASYTVEVS